MTPVVLKNNSRNTDEEWSTSIPEELFGTEIMYVIDAMDIGFTSLLMLCYEDGSEDGSPFIVPFHAVVSCTGFEDASPLYKVGDKVNIHDIYGDMHPEYMDKDVEELYCGKEREVLEVFPPQLSKDDSELRGGWSYKLEGVPFLLRNVEISLVEPRKGLPNKKEIPQGSLIRDNTGALGVLIGSGISFADNMFREMGSYDENMMPRAMIMPEKTSITEIYYPKENCGGFTFKTLLEEEEYLPEFIDEDIYELMWINK